MAKPRKNWTVGTREPIQLSEIHYMMQEAIYEIPQADRLKVFTVAELYKVYHEADSYCMIC